MARTASNNWTRRTLTARWSPTLPRCPTDRDRISPLLAPSGEFTWWLPRGADAYVLPISAGVVVDASRADLMSWLRIGSPWSLTELPIVGARYGNQTLVLIVPSPHYADLVVEDRVGVRFSFSRPVTRMADARSSHCAAGPVPWKSPRHSENGEPMPQKLGRFRVRIPWRIRLRATRK